MAGIIKAGTTVNTTHGSEPAPYQFLDVNEHVKQQLAAARAQGTELLAAAKREAELIKAKAEQQGQQAAVAKAEQLKRREVATQLATLRPALDQAVAALDDVHRKWMHHWERNLVHLACRIAEKLIRRQLDLTPEITLELIRESLELATGQNRLQVDLHPDDLNALGEQAAQLAQAWSRSAEVTFVAAPDVPKGSCRTRTEFGVIDQRFDEQLKRIEQELNS